MFSKKGIKRTAFVVGVSAAIGTGAVLTKSLSARQSLYSKREISHAILQENPSWKLTKWRRAVERQALIVFTQLNERNNSVIDTKKPALGGFFFGLQKCLNATNGNSLGQS
jgi:hypothetical protein